MDNKLIKQLRQKTGFGIMECKRALEEANGNMEEAKKVLAKGGKVKAEKKAEREAGEGVIDSYAHGNKIGALVELSCETDFVARSSEFKNLAHNLAMQIVSMAPNDIEELLAQSFIKDESFKIQELIEQAVGRLGENIKIKRFVRYELGGNDVKTNN